MFIQVITGTTTDPEGLRRQGERWDEELRPGAAGWLGSTGGVTEDGRFVIAVRFESEDAARRNSGREEQGAWWADTQKYLENVAFHDSAEINVMGEPSDKAGFVQVMRGRVTDKGKWAEIMGRMAEFEGAMRDLRPDVIGDVTVVHSDGSFTDVIYFTSEADARQGEAKPMPAELQALFEEFMAAGSVDDYLDLKEPWLR